MDVLLLARARTSADFPLNQGRNQIFLTWELPIEHVAIGQALGIDFDIDPSTSALLDDEQVWVNGARASVCPDSGRWGLADGSPAPPCCGAPAPSAV